MNKTIILITINHNNIIKILNKLGGLFYTMKHIKTIKQVDDRGVDTSVRVYYDENITRAPIDYARIEQDKLAKKEQVSQNTLANLGLESSLKKDERKFRLLNLIDQGKVVTVQSAVDALKLTRSTILRYAKETGAVLYDEKKQVWLNSPE